MRDLKIYVFAAFCLMLVYIVAEFNRPKPIDWTASYLRTDKIPLGTYVLYNRLDDIFPGATVQTFHEPVYNVINDHNADRATYIIICGLSNLNEYDYNKLIPFIKKGNDVFISAKYFGDFLSKKLNIDTYAGDYLQQQPDSIHFVSSRMDSGKVYISEKELGVNYFSQIDTARAVVVAQDNNHNSTLIKYRFGGGALYLSCNPNLFTNYSLLKPSGAAYAEKALSLLKDNKNILWDEYYSAGRQEENSAMRVFFKNPELKWAYYITLTGLIIYVVYQMKRRQRIIPAIAPLANSTVDFVNVIGQLYYEMRDNANIAQKKITYLLEFIRQRYRLQTSVFDREFIDALASVTAINTTEIEELIGVMNVIRASRHVSDKQLIELNNRIEKFYTKTR